MDRPDMKGLIAAIVTPMREDFSVDETSLRRYVGWLTDQAVKGLAVNVDTGEGPHLSAEERVRVLEVVAEEVGDRTLIVAGLAASFTEQAGREAADAARAGAGALLVFPIPVYQGEPLDPEIPVLYHRAVHEASGLPLIAFQLQPALGGVDFSAEVIERLMTEDGVVAIKEAFVRHEAVRRDREARPLCGARCHRAERERQLPARGLPAGCGGRAAGVRDVCSPLRGGGSLENLDRHARRFVEWARARD